MHFHGWKRGLKTGLYYLRTKAAVDAVKITVAESVVQTAKASTRPPPLTPSSLTSDATTCETAMPSPTDSSASFKAVEQCSLKQTDGTDVWMAEVKREVTLCPMRRKGAPLEEPCDMCSG
eukprot:GHVS01066795.1.p2 GENE.GHVS01066795.1~~GHVS01066795.1.p2  ORF type:complete len:120 (+),score=16.40 GHVS01066795.1:131-490(+)